MDDKLALILIAVGGLFLVLFIVPHPLLAFALGYSFARLVDRVRK